MRDFVRYFLIAVLLSPGLSALTGAAARVYLGDAFWITWRNWFLGNALAGLILTPFLLVMISTKRHGRVDTAGGPTEGLLVSAGLVIACYLAFVGGLGGQHFPPALLYLPVPFLLWGSVRFGPAGSPVSLLLLSLIAISGTLVGRGPFYLQSTADRLLSIQLFLLVVSCPYMFLSVVTTQQRRTDGALRESEERFRSLSFQVIHAQEAERSRIAQELHDDLSQTTATISMSLQYISRKYEENSALRNEFDQLQQSAATLGRDIVRVARQLHPGIVEKLGLIPSLRLLCQQASNDKRAVTFVCEKEVPQLGIDAAVSLYRVAQESLGNALSHSGATQVNIEARITTTTIQLSIQDNGCGFSMGSAATSGLGLSGMSERMKNAGGVLHILSAPGKGTTVTASVPIAKAIKATV